jgi:iron complex transport system permease protein
MNMAHHQDLAGRPVPMAGVDPGKERVRSGLTASRWLGILLVLATAALGVLLACLQFGVEQIGFRRSLAIVFRFLREGPLGPESEDMAEVILLQLRLPRVLLSFLVGSTLATIGVGLQALLRNPLADPYVLGISSGAALGAATAVLLGVGSSFMALSVMPLFAFAGGLFAIVLVYRIAVTYGRLPIHTLLLAGVILNAIFSALIMFMTSIMSPDRSFGMLAWLMGTLTAPSYPMLAVLGCYLVAGMAILLRKAHALNLLTLGEEAARSIGVEIESVKRAVFVTSALMTGAVVSVSGLIGFIGMVIPHAVRLVLGADHRLLLPAAGLVGGAFLAVADTVARTVLAPAEIPVGVVTALAGGPFFLYLLMAKREKLAL